MTLQELQKAVAKLSPDDLARFQQWFEKYVADAWDRQVEAEATGGKMDHLIKKDDRDVDAARGVSL